VVDADSATTLPAGSKRGMPGWTEWGEKRTIGFAIEGSARPQQALRAAGCDEGTSRSRRDTTQSGRRQRRSGRGGAGFFRTGRVFCGTFARRTVILLLPVPLAGRQTSAPINMGLFCGTLGERKFASRFLRERRRAEGIAGPFSVPRRCSFGPSRLKTRRPDLSSAGPVNFGRRLDAGREGGSGRCGRGRSRTVDLVRACSADPTRARRWAGPRRGKRSPHRSGREGLTSLELAGRDC